jgi:uncharacterized protein (UPF0276 family)
MLPSSNRLPFRAGIGLRAPHVNEVLAQRPDVPFFEVHSENYYLDGGPALGALARIRADYPLSLHGVGMSLGSADPLDRSHVEKLRTLIARVEPALVSEHLCWSGVAGRHLNDLLPLPYTDEALAIACARVSELQERLGREVAIENISSYLTFADSTIPEWDFVAVLARRTGCKLLLDVNNIYVNATNHGFDADAYVAAIPPDAVAEIHLAGFEEADGCLIDTHGAPVAPDVWALYARTIERLGSRPTLIEWDTDIPAFAVLQREAATAQRVLEARNAIAA